jgi:hypothetical protein
MIASRIAIPFALALGLSAYGGDEDRLGCHLEPRLTRTLGCSTRA